jgi:hypothetical protein
MGETTIDIMHSDKAIQVYIIGVGIRLNKSFVGSCAYTQVSNTTTYLEIFYINLYVLGHFKKISRTEIV